MANVENGKQRYNHASYFDVGNIKEKTKEIS